MRTNQITDSKRSKLVDQIIRERDSVGQLRELIGELDWSNKIAAAQIACYLISCTARVKLITLRPLVSQFSDRLGAVIALMELIPPEALAEIVIEIVEDPIKN